MRGITGVVIGAAVVGLAIMGVLWYQDSQKENEGGLYIGITDATADIANVNDIDVDIKKVELHSEAMGWTTVSSNARTYSLLTLKASGKTQLYAHENVAAGSYDRIRVTFGETRVKTKTNGTVKAVLPTDQLVADAKIVVDAKQDSHVKVDILADKSLHAAADNTYVFAPTARIESQSNATVSVASDDSVMVSGGKAQADVEVGMDLAGSSIQNFTLTTDGTLRFTQATTTENRGKVLFMLGNQTIVGNSAQHETSGGSSASEGVSVTGSGTATTSGAKAQGSAGVDLQGSVNF